MLDDTTKRKMIMLFPDTEHVRLLRLISYLEETTLPKNRYQIAIATNQVATTLASTLEEWARTGYIVASGSIYNSNERTYVLSV